MSTKKSKGVPFCVPFNDARELPQAPKAVRIKPAAEQTNVRLRNLLGAVITKATKSAACQVRDVEEVAQSWLSQEPAPARTGDQIVYKAIEYRKHGEHCRQAMFKHDPNSYSGADEVQVVVVNMEIAKAQALAKLDGVDRLVLGL